ncbi:MAG: D-2-hydroxyacid dehydrogenase [Capsulimonadales bacterium]|nr:D-2-hydroxyacid dehydrogenase [Capsulimonadales bacterium]
MEPLRLVCLSRPDAGLTEALTEALAALGDSVRLSFVAPEDAVDDPEIRRADGILCGTLPPEVRAVASRLRWVQFWSAGLDGKLFPELFEGGVLVTSGAGIHEASASEHVLAMMLAFARGLPQAFAAQQRKDWSARRTIYDQVFELQGKTVGIVGAGKIGQAIGVRCQAFGMKTVGTRRDPSVPTPGIDVLLSHIQYHDLILSSDFIVLALPLTPQTRMIFGEDEIEILRKGTYLFNIGRGGLIDERWVYRALKNGWLAGAGLDVFAEEPLPPDSPFWELPNCLITPHVGGHTPLYWPRFARLVVAQIARLRNGEPPENQVRPTLGY